MPDLRPAKMKKNGLWVVRSKWRSIRCAECHYFVQHYCLEREMSTTGPEFMVPYEVSQTPCEHENSPHLYEPVLISAYESEEHFRERLRSYVEKRLKTTASISASAEKTTDAEASGWDSSHPG